MGDHLISSLTLLDAGQALPISSSRMPFSRWQGSVGGMGLSMQWSVRLPYTSSSKLCSGLLRDYLSVSPSPGALICATLDVPLARGMPL